MQFRPSLEQLRYQCIDHLKHSISVPSSFAGFGSMTNFFESILYQSSVSNVLLTCYKAIEVVLNRIENAGKALDPFLVLMLPDLGKLIASRVISADSFAANFRNARAHAREADKLSDSIAISFANVRFCMPLFHYRSRLSMLRLVLRRWCSHTLTN